MPRVLAFAITGGWSCGCSLLDSTVYCSSPDVWGCRGNLVVRCSERFDGDEPTGEFVESVWTDCSTQRAVCEEGSCLLRDEACPAGVSSFCRDEAVWRCRGDGVLAASEPCEELTCFDVKDDQGARAVCALDTTPCRSDDFYSSDCDGDTLVRCQVGFPVARVACDAPAAICEEHTAAYAACGSSLCSKQSNSSQCVDGVVLACTDLGDYVRSDCAVDGNHCVTDGDVALCSSVAQSRPQRWIPLPSGSFPFRTQVENGVEQLEVSVAAFEILETEVTELQFRACIQAGVCSRDVLGLCSASNLADAPAVCVADQAAADYCAWIGGMLPTEHQWQYALVSAGERMPFPWGDATPTCSHAVLTDSALSMQAGCGTGATWPTCSHPAGITQQGICDLVGNASELVVMDRSELASVYPLGGSFRTPTTNTNNVLPMVPRSRSDSRYGEDYVGFRCVR
jgi:formylglycine-generating enzyme required for sulfatase activity